MFSRKARKLTVGGAVPILLGVVCVLVASPTFGEKILLQGGTVHPVSGPAVEGSVLLDQGSIVAVGPSLDAALTEGPRQDRPTKPIEWVDIAPDAMTTKAPATWPSFEAQSHGVCTRCLRFVPPLLTTTQDSLPAGG